MHNIWLSMGTSFLRTVDFPLDILDEILGFLDTQSLAIGASTNSSWYALTLKYIWEDVPSLVVLLNLLAPLRRGYESMPPLVRSVSWLFGCISDRLMPSTSNLPILRLQIGTNLPSMLSTFGN